MLTLKNFPFSKLNTLMLQLVVGGGRRGQLKCPFEHRNLIKNYRNVFAQKDKIVLVEKSWSNWITNMQSRWNILIHIVDRYICVHSTVNYEFQIAFAFDGRIFLFLCFFFRQPILMAFYLRRKVGNKKAFTID